jgi:TetR/AcrR family transcriptional regulator
MTSIASSQRGSPQERILATAVVLFAKVGYNGASVRDIARSAEVNEVTIYRHYTSKRMLFNAAVESELQKLSTCGLAVSGQLAETTDLNSAFHIIFNLIVDAVARHPNMVRLLQYSALEFGRGIEPLYRKYLGELLESSANHFRRCAEVDRLSCSDPQTIFLAFAATAVCLETFYPAVTGEASPLRSRSDAASDFTELWLVTLAGRRSKAAF